MSKWGVAHLKKRAKRTYNRIGGPDVVKRREAATAFAKKHGLMYFHTVGAESDTAPVIRGATATVKQVDSNFCIGAHAGYEMALVERSADVTFVGFESTFHTWYVLEIDLRHASNLPFLFIGTKQLPKAFYAKVLMSRRGVRYLQLPEADAAFHSSYALIAGPSQLPLLHTLFDQETRAAMAAHKHPFAVEIEGDSLILFTEANKPSEQLMDKLLHYGLWLAEKIDSRSY